MFNSVEESSISLSESSSSDDSSTFLDSSSSITVMHLLFSRIAFGLQTLHDFISVVSFDVKNKHLSIEILELQTSYHCNLSCKGCSHCSPLENESFFDVDKEIENLKLLTNVLHIKIVKLIGGEPLLNKNIVYIIKKLKENKIADEVWVATNGILLNTINKELIELVDGFEISVYNYNKKFVEQIKNTLKTHLKGSQKAFIYFYSHFRKPFMKEENADKQLVLDIYQNCLFSQVWQCFNYHDGYFFKCPQSWALSRHFKNFKLEEVGIKILGNQNLQESITNYITNSQPLKACNYCMGCVGQLFKIEQIAKDKWKDSIQNTSEVDFFLLEKLKKDKDLLIDTISKTIFIEKGKEVLYEC